MTSLTPRRKKQVSIIDPIYGLIELSAEMESFIADEAFQRLKFIKQLASVFFTHKLAIHTRYEHSVGVAFLAKKAVEVLMAQDIDKQISEQEALAVEFAALYHDIGHGAYSHVFDSILRESKTADCIADHEHRSMILFENVARKHSMPMDQIRRVQYFIDPAKYLRKYQERPIFTAGLDQIVNNSVCGLDVDKMDYLNRDSLFLGLEKIFEPIDMINIIKNTCLIDGNWSFDACDCEHIYNICCRRFALYASVYMSDKSIVIAQMLTESIKAANHVKPFLACTALRTSEEITQFCALTDNYIAETLILNDNDPRMETARNYMKRIVKRDGLFRITSRFVVMGNTEPMFHGDINTKFVKSKLATDESNPDKMMARVPFKSQVVPIDRKDIKAMYMIVKTDLLTPKT